MTDTSLPAGGIPQDLGARRTDIVPARSAAGILASIFFCSVLLGQVAKIPLIATETKTAPILLSDVIAGVLCLWLLASVLVAGRIRLDWPALLLSGFVAVNTLAIAVAAVRYGLTGAEVAFSSLYLVRWTMYAALYLFALTAIRRAAAPALIRLGVTVCTVFASFGIIQSALLPNFAFIVYPDAIPYVDWDVQGHRLVSTFLDPNFAGAFILFGLLFYHARRAASGRQVILPLALYWTALLLTLSRSSIGAAIVGLGVITLRTGSLRKLFLPLALFAVVAWVAADQILEFAASYQKLSLTDPSALRRLTAWLLAWRIFADNPLIGIGFNTFGFVRAAYSSGASGNAAFGSDGGVLYIAAVSGLAGVALLGGALWRLWILGLRTYRTTSLPEPVRELGLTLHAWIPCLIVHSAASNSIFYPFIIGPLFLLGGLCARQYYAGSAR
jgi:O-antigen ligase